MARKPRKPSRSRAHPKRSSNAASTRVRTPSQWRVVTSRAIESRTPGRSGARRRHSVPQIRLSGAWLERLGFPSGTRYLISAEREFRTLILQAVDD